MNLTISADLKACDIFKMIEEQKSIFWYAHKEKVVCMFRRGYSTTQTLFCC